MERLTKMICGKVMYPVKIRSDDKYHYFIESPFNLKDEFKAMKGAKWMGYDPIQPEKVWRVDNCRRNNFNIAYLEGKNPFAKYTKPLDPKSLGAPIRTQRKDWNGKVWDIYKHQQEMTLHILIRRQCIISGEMGVGKTLAAFEAMELSLVPEVWYVAPKSALTSVRLEAMRWCLRTKVKFMTYDELKKILKDWKPGDPPPRFVVFDESSRVKTPSSQRSQAAFYLAEAMRDAYGDDAYIVLMSGSPAPKSPLDWYWQCEIACPGFVREGDIHKFENRLAIKERKEDITGTGYSKILAWKDGNPNVCKCGLRIDNPVHVKPAETDALFNEGNKNYHEFEKIDNEVEKLYRRMAGLTYVKFKKDCLDLPDKIYREISLKPSLDLLRAARLVQSTAKNAITAMTLLRELSDGFQYKDVLRASEVCEACQGNKVLYQNDGSTVPCMLCNATGSKNKVEREIIEVASPKLEAVTDLLDEMEEVGRIVLYAGFTASIDRLCAHVRKHDWHFVRVDGRGWFNSINHTWNDIRTLQEFQKQVEGYTDKFAFIAHPGSAGMGLTLTASPMIVYVSNDFNGESRIQSEDRIHRAGMDVNRGATIVDLLLLPTDRKVLQNLRRKRELQSISLGELQEALDNFQYTTTGV